MATSHVGRSVRLYGQEERRIPADQGGSARTVAVSAIPYLEREGRWGRIVEVAEKAAEELDCVTTEVTSARCRVESRPFYQSLGFEEWDDRSVRYLKDPVPGPLKHWSLVDAGSRSAVAGS